MLIVLISRWSPVCYIVSNVDCVDFKVASASYSKFAELKDSITTPVKNAASLSSLTRSQDDLDGAGSDRSSLTGSGVGYGDEDRSSLGSRDRYRQLQGSHERLSMGGEDSAVAAAADAAQQASFGENSLGKWHVDC
jgi:hypothetical protein